MWHLAKLTFELCMIAGTVLLGGYFLLCLVFASVRRNTDRYQRNNAARNYRVGGSINP